MRLVLCDASIRSIVKPIPACPIGWFPAEERYSHLDELEFSLCPGTNRNGAFGCPDRVWTPDHRQSAYANVQYKGGGGELGRHGVLVGNKQQAKPTAYKYANAAPGECRNFVTSTED